MERSNIFYDKDFRSKIRNSDKDSLKQLVVSMSGDVQTKVLTNSKSTTYFVIPNISTMDTAGLYGVQAAGKVGTAGSVATASTGGSIGSICGSLGSIFSFGTLGSAATYNPE